MDDKLSDLDAIYVSCVLEDCVDQLAILGTIMPSNLERRANAEQVKMNVCANLDSSHAPKLLQTGKVGII